MSEKIAVIGLGYVGMPLLVGLSKKFKKVIGFDIDSKRITALRIGHDWTGEVADADLQKQSLVLTDRKEDLADCDFFIVSVPTPIDDEKRPDLTPVDGACRTLGAILRMKGAHDKTPLIVFESTVWPGLTDEFCGSLIEEVSGLKRGVDFKLGYSPERINPGDKNNRLETIVKVISAEDEESLNRLQEVYGAVVTAGLHRAPSIMVAEAAKVIENTQRDLNIALMNEIALICDRMNIRTKDVLAAAGTKWNFLKFTPGLVGGHCIGVDPYYLTARAQRLGYHPEVILAGRKINDNMPIFVAQKMVKLLSLADKLHKGSRVAVLGLTFKENVRDIRNSRVPDIAKELESYGIEVIAYDPVADPSHVKHEYNIDLCKFADLKNLDGVIYAVPHAEIKSQINEVLSHIVKNGVVIDVKSDLNSQEIPSTLYYWSL